MNENSPLVSVCIPAYNHEKYIAECIESIINQCYKNIELIIINDGSRDNTNKVIMNYIDKLNNRFTRFEYRNRENKGLSATLNEAVEWSDGKYFSPIASDDILLSNKISSLVDCLKNLDDTYAAAFGNAIFIDDKSNEIYLEIKNKSTKCVKKTKYFLEFYTYNRNIKYSDKAVFGSYKTLLEGNYLPAMSAVIKLDKIKEVGAWTNGITIEDWEMWLKLAKSYKFAYVDKPVAFYRIHTNNSIKIISKKVHYDSLIVIKNNKEYANNHGFKNIYYKSLVRRILDVRHFSKKDFLIFLLRNSVDIEFLKMLLKEIIKKVFL